MGRLTHIKSDLFTTSRPVIAHGCNTRGGFGSGVAGQIARLYPEARNAYLKKHNHQGWKLGEVQFVEVPVVPELLIVNMATQDTFGGPGVHVDYEAVRQCFATVLDFCQAGENNMGLAIPKVGAGLAGGDWNAIQAIIVSLLMTRDVEVDVHSLE